MADQGELKMLIHQSEGSRLIRPKRLTLNATVNQPERLDDAGVEVIEHGMRGQNAGVTMVSHLSCRTITESSPIVLYV